MNISPYRIVCLGMNDIYRENESICDSILTFILWKFITFCTNCAKEIQKNEFDILCRSNCNFLNDISNAFLFQLMFSFSIFTLEYTDCRLILKKNTFIVWNFSREQTVWNNINYLNGYVKVSLTRSRKDRCCIYSMDRNLKNK